MTCVRSSSGNRTVTASTFSILYRDAYGHAPRRALSERRADTAVLGSQRYRPRFRRSALTLSRYPIATIAKSGWAMNVKSAMA